MSKMLKYSAGKLETLNPGKNRVSEKVRFRGESAIVAAARDGWFADKAKLVRATWTVQTCAALSKYIYIERVGELHGVLAANVDKVSPVVAAHAFGVARTLSLPAVRCRRRIRGADSLGFVGACIGFQALSAAQRVCHEQRKVLGVTSQQAPLDRAHQWFETARRGTRDRPRLLWASAGRPAETIRLAEI